jgi:hypothetical protein
VVRWGQGEGNAIGLRGLRWNVGEQWGKGLNEIRSEVSSPLNSLAVSPLTCCCFGVDGHSEQEAWIGLLIPVTADGVLWQGINNHQMSPITCTACVRRDVELAGANRAETISRNQKDYKSEVVIVINACQHDGFYSYPLDLIFALRTPIMFL